MLLHARICVLHFTWKKTPCSVHGRFPSQKFMYQAVLLYWLTVICISIQNLPAKMKTLVCTPPYTNLLLPVHALSPVGIKPCWQFINRQVSVILLLHLRKIKISSWNYFSAPFFLRTSLVIPEMMKLRRVHARSTNFCRQTDVFKVFLTWFCVFRGIYFLSKSWFLLKINKFSAARLFILQSIADFGKISL